MIFSYRPFEKLLIAAGLHAPEHKAGGDGFDIWSVKATNPFGGTKLHVLHLKSDATWSSARNVQTLIKQFSIPSSSLFAIREESSRLDGTARILKEFGVQKVLSRQQLLGEALKATISRPDGSGPDLDSRFFVPPKLTSNFSEPSHHSAIDLLSTWLEGKGPATPGVGVVVANSGIGKTTLARRLYQSLSKKDDRGRVPVLIESYSWRKLSDAPDLTLWDVWKEGLSAGAVGISAEDTFETCIREGILLPIFDGFDELCLLRSRQFRAEEVLANLQALVVESNGRLLITTREGFWNDVDDEVRQQCTVFNLEPFDQHLRNKFFEDRFPTNFTARTAAKKVMQRIETEAHDNPTGYPNPLERITSIPAVLELISGSVETNGSEATLQQYGALLGRDPLKAILLALCERERARHELIATADEQLDVFAELARGWTENGLMNRENIELVAQDSCAAFADQHQREKLFLPHSMIEGRGNEFSFRFDFLRDYLQAIWLEKHWSDATKFTEFSELVADDAFGPLSQVLEYTVQCLINLNNHIEVLQRLADARKRFTELMLHKSTGGLWHLATSYFNRTGVVTRLERTDKLLELFGTPASRRFDGLQLRNRIASLDLRGVEFINCKFDGCTFFGCDYNEASSFTSCDFLGPFRFDRCTGAPNLVSPAAMSAEAREALAGSPSHSIKLINQDMIRRAFRLAFQKFARGAGFQAIDVDIRNRGPLGHSPLKDDVWESLERSGIVTRHSISGVGRDRGMAISAESFNDVRQFVDNALISGRLAQAMSEVAATHGVTIY